MQVETFRTTNRQLAFALISAGCSLAPQDEESAGPAQNRYTLGFLRQHRIQVGKPFEEAVKWCVDHRIPGEVTYIFARNSTLDAAIAAWDAMVNSWLYAKQEAEPGKEPDFPVPDISTETVMQVLFVYANSLEKMTEIPFFNTALCSVEHTEVSHAKVPNRSPGVKEEFAPGDKTIITGSCKTWTLGASAATKSHLKV